MKLYGSIIVALRIAIVFLSVSVCRGQAQESDSGKDKSAGSSGRNISTAIVITGAASRIPQEAALLEQLEITGWLNDVIFISGASSGALNAVMLNAILNKEYSWERYKKILFGITNSQVYSSGEKRLPLNTHPLRELLVRIVNDSLGYKVIGDLPFPSAISATSVRLPPPRRQAMRFSNMQINEESNPSYNLIDILMASTAIPLVFPSVKINNAADFPDETFKDGGVFDDRIPYEAVLQYQRFSGKKIDKLIIVSRKSDSVKSIQYELENLGFKNTKMLEDLGAFLQNYSQDSFVKKLKEFEKTNPDLAARTYIYIPEFKENFPMLDFNTMEEQYGVTSEWAKRNQPILLSEYLKINKIH